MTHSASDRERVLGRDHPDTLTSQNNLAAAYRSAGNLTEAIPLYEKTLADRERVVGPDHPDTLISRSNLASAYGAAGNLVRVQNRPCRAPERDGVADRERGQSSSDKTRLIPLGLTHADMGI